MSSFQRRAGRAFNRTVETVSQAGQAIADAGASFLGAGIDLATDGLSAGLPILSNLLGSESDEGGLPGVEADPVFVRAHDAGEEGITAVEPTLAPTVPPYKRAINAFDDGDVEGAVAAFGEMKPEGRRRLAANRPELVEALVAAGDPVAADVVAQQAHIEIENALIDSDKRADALFDEAWDRYAATRDEAWFARIREGARVALPTVKTTIDVEGVPVSFTLSASGVVERVMRDDRWDDVEVAVPLACTSRMVASGDGRSAEATLTFVKQAVVGRDTDGQYGAAEAATDWARG